MVAVNRTQVADRPNGRIHFFDLKPDEGSFLDDTIAGLSKPQKTLSPKYFYDQAGSILFDRICETKEYYVTRTELGLLASISGDIADLAGPESTVIEYGSGASVKVRILLDALERPAGYVAIDISRDHLTAAAQSIADDYLDLKVVALCADFTNRIDLPSELDLGGELRLGFFPGSTIGNFSPEGAQRFLCDARNLLAPDGALLLGFDLKKDQDILNTAYNDSEGITALFNKNILVRMKRELDAVLDVDAFGHHAFYNEAQGRIEMHLKAERDQTIILGEHKFELKAGESIHTENSYKYDMDQITTWAERLGFTCDATWTDPNEYFGIVFLSTGGEQPIGG